MEGAVAIVLAVFGLRRVWDRRVQERNKCSICLHPHGRNPKRHSRACTCWCNCSSLENVAQPKSMIFARRGSTLLWTMLRRATSLCKTPAALSLFTQSTADCLSSCDMFSSPMSSKLLPSNAAHSNETPRWALHLRKSGMTSCKSFLSPKARQIEASCFISSATFCSVSCRCIFMSAGAAGFSFNVKSCTVSVASTRAQFHITMLEARVVWCPVLDGAVLGWRATLFLESAAFFLSDATLFFSATRSFFLCPAAVLSAFLADWGWTATVCNAKSSKPARVAIACKTDGDVDSFLKGREMRSSPCPVQWQNHQTSHRCMMPCLRSNDITWP